MGPIQSSQHRARRTAQRWFAGKTKESDCLLCPSQRVFFRHWGTLALGGICARAARPTLAGSPANK